MADYSKIPSGVKIQPKPFKAHTDTAKLQQLKDLVRLSPVSPATFENTNAGRKYGMTREYLLEAKKYWETDFNWQKWEDRINSFPNFITPVVYQSVTIDVHFLALFSEKVDAIPIAFYHGWPGSILEFLDLLDVVKSKYSPQDLPYHIIVPSLPGYVYSSGPPVDTDYSTNFASGQLDQFMKDLGFAKGYLAQGGDVGSSVALWQAHNSDSCKGMHLNMVSVPEPGNSEQFAVDKIEKEAMEWARIWTESGRAYFLEHGTRTSTIGLALSASPIALLSWIGEKFLEWSDQDPSVDEILASVTLYWLTDTYARCIYQYRSAVAGLANPPIQKPSGYSLFPYDLAVAPKSWFGAYHNLVSYSQHESGGHFAAMEKPHELLADVEAYVKKAWSSSKL